MAWLSTPIAGDNPNAAPGGGAPDNRIVLSVASWGDSCYWFGLHLTRDHAITRVRFDGMTYAAASTYQTAWKKGTTISGTIVVIESRLARQNAAGAYQVFITYEDPGSWSAA